MRMRRSVGMVLCPSVRESIVCRLQRVGYVYCSGQLEGCFRDADKSGLHLARAKQNMPQFFAFLRAINAGPQAKGYGNLMLTPGCPFHNPAPSPKPRGPWGDGMPSSKGKAWLES